MKNSRMFFIALLICLTGVSVVAQQFPEKLPVDYKGDGFVAVQRLLWPYDKNLAKSEFETWDEHKERKQKFLSSTKINGHPLTQTIFVVKPYCSYDAEAKSFYCISLKEEERVEGPDEKVWHKLTLSTVGKEHPFTQWNWSVDGKKAQEVKPNLRVAISGAPLMASDTTIFFEPSQAIFFNQATGEIYRKLSIGTVEKE